MSSLFHAANFVSATNGMSPNQDNKVAHNAVEGMCCPHCKANPPCPMLSFMFIRITSSLVQVAILMLTAEL